MREEIQDPDGEIERLRAEVDRLKDKCNRQARILQSLTPDKFPGVLFICGRGGQVDKNGLPDRLYICPSYGVDWSEVYVRYEKTIGPDD